MDARRADTRVFDEDRQRIRPWHYNPLDSLGIGDRVSSLIDSRTD
jgi:hypothetical protein